MSDTAEISKKVNNESSINAGISILKNLTDKLFAT